MTGKNKFTREEIEELRILVKKFSKANEATERKSIRTRFRKLQFYVSDFGIQNIDVSQFEALLRSGKIQITGNGLISVQKPQVKVSVVNVSTKVEENLIKIENNLVHGKFISAKDLDGNAKLDCTGFYCIKLNVGSKFSDRYQNHLDTRNHRIIYIGKAEGQTLRKRFLGQELKAKGHGTFFRSIGAVLGYTPEKGSLTAYLNKKNYKFSSKDEIEIIDWINENLEVNWAAYSGNFMVEKTFVIKYSPLLNDSHNPKKLQELKFDKANCRSIANQIIS
jgi:hypothetical protein